MSIPDLILIFFERRHARVNWNLRSLGTKGRRKSEGDRKNVNGTVIYPSMQ
jgi:hypothetical protein